MIQNHELMISYNPPVINLNPGEMSYWAGTEHKQQREQLQAGHHQEPVQQRDKQLHQVVTKYDLSPKYLDKNTCCRSCDDKLNFPEMMRSETLDSSLSSKTDSGKSSRL